MTQFFHYFEHFIGRSEGQRGLCVGQCGQAQKHKSTAIAPKSPNLFGSDFLEKNSMAKIGKNANDWMGGTATRRKMTKMMTMTMTMMARLMMVVVKVQFMPMVVTRLLRRLPKSQRWCHEVHRRAISTKVQYTTLKHMQFNNAQ